MTDPPFHYETLPDILGGISPLIVIAAWVWSASFIGAEWHWGTISTALTWQPRRLRLFAAKASFCLAVTFPLSAALCLLLAGVLLPAGAWRGTFEGVGLAWAVDLAETVAPVATMGVVGSACGLAIAAAARNTAAGIGEGFASAPWWRDSLGASDPSGRAGSSGTARPCSSRARARATSADRTTGDAAVVLLIYAVGLLGTAAVTFRMCDVT